MEISDRGYDMPACVYGEDEEELESGAPARWRAGTNNETERKESRRRGLL